MKAVHEMRRLPRFVCLVLVLLWSVTFTIPAMAANGCSIYSNYGGNSGKTWFNEHYYGSTVPDFLEVFSRNSTVTASDSSVWSKWYIRLYDKNDKTYTFPLGEKTTACTTSGGRTYITHVPGWNLNFNDAMIVVFDGDPDDVATKEIDAYVYSNTIPPVPYTYFFGNYYTPTCGELRTSIDSQVLASMFWGLFTGTYSGQNVLIMPNFNNKDNSRIPDGTGKWEETSDGGSGTTFTQCVTNDPVDIVKSFIWAPKYPTAVYSGTVDPGAVVTFTISARNSTKASMSGVRISDTLPSGLTLSGAPTATGGATASCTGATCVLIAPASLPAGATVSMTFNATVTSDAAFAGATIKNVAVQTAGTSYNPAPMAEAFVTVGSGLTLTMAADKNPAVYTYDDRVTFTVTAKNSTSYPMAGTVVTIPFPSGLTWYSGYTPVVSSGGGTVSCDATSCIWTLPATLNAGATPTPTLTFQATASGAPSQVMTITATQTAGATLTTNPTASAVVTMAGAAVAGFNACHNYVASDASTCSSVKGRLFTRLVNSAFSTDIVALKSDDTVFKDFVGASGAARTVTVDLIDQLNNVVATQNVTFPAGDTTGHVLASWPALDKAYPKLQVRITDSSGVKSVISLSSDSFAVRPSAVAFTTTASATSPSTSATPTIKAGTAFTINASTNPTASYGGTLSLDTAKLSGSTVRGNLYAAGTTNVLSLQANTTASNNASYDEVGYLYAAAGAFRDDTFTAIDQNAPAGCNPAADCDCISSPTSNAYLSDVPIGSPERYGCSIGNKADVSFGRFIPDHFTVSAVLINRSELTGCSSSFTYMGGEPMRLTLTLRACKPESVPGDCNNPSNTGITKNYNGTSGFARLDGTKANWTDASSFGKPDSIGLGAVDGTTPLSARLKVSNLASNWTEGKGTLVADVVFSRLTTNPDGAFDNLQLGVAPQDLDGVTLLPAALNLDADLAAPTNERQLVATTKVRYGRVRLSNAHGSELLPLSVPLRLEYFKAGTGFVAAGDDTCSGTKDPVANTNMDDFAVGDLKVTNPRVNMTVSASTPSFARTPSPGGVLSAIKLTAPGGGKNGSIDLELDVPAWLKFTWDGASSSPRNPRARATFGVYKSNNQFIYMRENY